VSEAKPLKTLEDENARLKRLLADAMDNAALKDLLGGGLLLQLGHDEIRARDSGTCTLNYIVTSITYEFVVSFRTIPLIFGRPPDPAAVPACVSCTRQAAADMLFAIGIVNGSSATDPLATPVF